MCVCGVVWCRVSACVYMLVSVRVRTSKYSHILIKRSKDKRNEERDDIRMNGGTKRKDGVLVISFDVRKFDGRTTDADQTGPRLARILFSFPCPFFFILFPFFFVFFNTLFVSTPRSDSSSSRTSRGRSGRRNTSIRSAATNQLCFRRN